MAAAAAWPASGRSAWISGMKLTREPCSASTERAHAMSAVLRDPAGADEPQRADGAHELGPVDEREPLLRLQPDRLEAGAGERVRP